MTRLHLLAMAPLAVALTIGAAAQTEAPATDPLLRRWVGHHKNVPIFFDFYGDSMLVVNDRHALDFRFTWDSIVAWGDTSLAVAYEFRYDRLLITTEQGIVFTMAPQSILARPLEGRFGSSSGYWVADTDMGTLMIEMRRGGTARWRLVPGGSWEAGEWNRTARNITFVWRAGEPDSTVWEGIYDAPAALMFEETLPGSGIAIFRRRIR